MSKKNIFNILLGGSIIGVAAILIIAKFAAQPQSAPIVTTLPPLKTQEIQASPEPRESSWISPDGKLQVKMTVLDTGDSTQTYSFSVATSSAQFEPPFFTKTVAGENTFLIPHNTFSIDNQHLFLEEKTPDKSHFLVFTVSGKSFKGDQPYIDVTEAFEKFTSKYRLQQVTGWAAEKLLIVLTRTEDGTTGPSFWFDLSNQSFIQLSSRF